MYFRVPLSIDGLQEEHDALRGTPGAFAGVEESYVRLKDLQHKYTNLTVDANAVFCRANQDTMTTTLAWLDENRDFDNLSMTLLRGDIDNPEEWKASTEKYIKANWFLNALHKKNEQRSMYQVWRAVRDLSRDHLIEVVQRDAFILPCVAGRKLVVVSEVGEVSPCEMLGVSFGSLRECGYDIHALLRSAKAQAVRKHIIDSRCRCSFECALAANILWNFRSYPALLNKMIANILTGLRGG